jgi:hypothetical protein
MVGLFVVDDAWRSLGLLSYQLPARLLQHDRVLVALTRHTLAPGAVAHRADLVLLNR